MNMLGLTVTDRITGFTGVVTGQVEYLTGCSQALVAPKAKDGSLPSSEWFDFQRVVVDEMEARVVLDNGATPGCDRGAPRR